PIKLKYPDGDTNAKKACESIQKQVRENTGLELQLIACLRIHDDVKTKKDYELAYYSIDYPDETYRLWPWLSLANRKGGKNFLEYEPEGQLLQLMRTAAAHRDIEKVQGFTHLIHEKFREDLPFIPLWQLDTHIAIHADVQTYPEPS